MDLDRIIGAVTALDMALTGASVPKAVQTLNSQKRQIERMVNEYTDLDYHLSDSGYSRLQVDPVEKLVFLSSNSTDKVKAAWTRQSELVAALTDAL